jgi:hypothetical protein
VCGKLPNYSRKSEVIAIFKLKVGKANRMQTGEAAAVPETGMAMKAEYMYKYRPFIKNMPRLADGQLRI